MTSFGLFAFCTTLKKLNTLMANLLLVVGIPTVFPHYVIEVNKVSGH